VGRRGDSGAARAGRIVWACVSVGFTYGYPRCPASRIRGIKYATFSLESVARRKAHSTAPVT